MDNDKRSIPFKDIESIPCPKCKQESGWMCRAMAGRGVTFKDKLVPHVERAIAYLHELEGKKEGAGA